ncbi:TOTE conflict system archaeo-eukaryotic primase domain-containing protein [Alicyclobacillus tolerans]|uniref:TOTE conflict system primase domain-containing protein n=1 Tax=Alicyclobacillus tolerans TaxID=90970 RepID=A0ABT9LZJ5_9BACL|nr:hypothetical protein [Alicyclobacillus tengchongensis]MDP9729678.1 hypothetical protein [Alicyclobacillus tengchongensis]
MYAKPLTVEEAIEEMIPVLKEPPIQCALCGRYFERITPGHLRTHAEFLRSKTGVKWFRPKQERKDNDDEDMQSSSDNEPAPWKYRDETLMETYERLFGGKDQLTACVQKLLDLYKPHRGKWLLMDKPVLPSYATWYQVSSEDPAFKPNRLCVSILKEHLMLECTVGVFPKSQYETHFVTWDVDAKPLYGSPSRNASIEAEKAALAITSILRKWGINPHVIMSGGKGYHVTVFFRTGVSIKLAMQLFNAVLQHPDGPQVGVGLKVECLPIQRGNKLPLGINWGAGRYCGFLDPHTLELLANPYEYLLNIVPDNTKTLFEIQDDGLAERKRDSTVVVERSWSADITEGAFKVGIVTPGTRHDTLVRVAAYVRNTPSLCPDSFAEFVDVLMAWSRKEYEQHRTNIKTGWAEHLRDLERVAKYVWSHPLTPGVPRTVRITAAVVHWIRSQTPVLAEQQLAFAAWFRMTQIEEHFYFGYQQAREMTALAKDSLDKALKALRDKGILCVTDEYFHSSKGIVPSRTRKYRFGNSPPKSTSTAVLLTLTHDQWEPSLWFRLLRTLMTREQLKAFYPFAYHRILRAEPLPIGRSTA